MEKSKALQSRLSAAINAQKIRMDEANSYMDFLKGKQYQGKPKKDEVTFNICHTTVQAILNSILMGKPYIYVEPETKEAVESAPLVEKIINKYWQVLKVDYQLELAVIDYAWSGLGVLYTDWELKLDEKKMIVSDDPFVLHIPYEDFLIDPDATTEEIYQAKYMIRRFRKPTKELKADSRYKHTKNIKGDKKLSEEITKENSEEVERTTLYQIWIPEDGASYTMRENSEDILRETENKFGREYPFVLLQNYKMPGELFPFGEVKILYEQQKMLNQIFTMILKHARKVSTRQYIANSQISDTERRKLKDAEDGEILSVEGTARAQDVISPIMDAALSADVYRAYDIINSSIVQLSSISEYRRSITPDKQRKATEANYIEQGTEMSTNKKAEDVQEACEEVAKKLFTLIASEQNIESREITYKDDKSGQWVSQSYNGSSFPGKYAFRWESGVAGPLNAATRQQKILQLLSTLSSLTSVNPQLMAKINWTELLSSIMDTFDIKNKEEILTPEEPQMVAGMENTGMENTAMAEQGQTNPELVNRVAQMLQGGR